MAFDDMFEIDHDLDEEYETPDLMAAWDADDGSHDAHVEDRLLTDLCAWARKRGFDGAQEVILTEALRGAFDRLSDLPPTDAAPG